MLWPSTINSDLRYDILHISRLSGPKVDDYVYMTVPSRKYSMLFFNTKSDKLSPKINRALGGLIFNQFSSDPLYKDHLLKNHLWFDRFLSTGDQVGKYIVAKNPKLPLDKYDLEKIDIVSLPQEVKLTVNDTSVYFLERFQWYKSIKFSFAPDSYKNVTISYNGTSPYSPKTFNSVDWSFFYSLSLYNRNIDEWLNKYVIKGVDSKGEQVTIGMLDLYYLTTNLDENADILDEDKINVLYFNDEVSRFVVDRLRAVFIANKIDEYFLFHSFDDVDQFDGKLLSLDYDVVVRTVNLWLRSDISSLLWSSVPTLNPSVYTNDTFVSRLSQYVNESRSDFLYDQLMNVYMQDVPFVVLGNVYDGMYIRSPLVSYVSDSVVGLYDVKKLLLQRVVFGSHAWFFWNDVFDMSHFKAFFLDL